MSYAKVALDDDDVEETHENEENQDGAETNSNDEAFALFRCVHPSPGSTAGGEHHARTLYPPRWGSRRDLTSQTGWGQQDAH